MEIVDFLEHTFLFRGTDPATISVIIQHCDPSIITYKRGEEIYNSETGKGRVGFVVSGRCEVRRSSTEEKSVVLNILEKYSSFGILSALSADEFPTQIFASKNTEILYFNPAEIDYFVNNYSQISRNLIDFLVNRIHFLNTKISTFSGTRVENRLAAFIVFEYKKQNSDRLDFNCMKTSEGINAGRASVYRALSSLENSGLIEFNKNKLHILDFNGLERLSK